MNSIRKKLTLSLLVALGVIWAISQGFVFHAIRKATISTFDQELEPVANDVRFYTSPRPPRREGPNPFQNDSPRPNNEERSALFQNAEPPPPPPDEDEFKGPEEYSQRAKLFSEAGSGLYFQIYSENIEESKRKSPSLGEYEIPLLVDPSEKPKFYDYTLPNGSTIRVMAENHRRFPGPRPGPGSRRDMGEWETILVGRDRSELDASINHYLLAFAVVGLIAALATIVIINYLLGHGLKPLNSLAKQVEKIDDQSLDARLQVSNTPEELVTITDRLNELLERLHESFERERRFSSDASHELRTPVAELRALSEVSLKWPASVTGDHFKTVLSISNRMESTLDGLLKLSRLDSNQVNLDYEPVDLTNLLANLRDRYSDDAKRKSIAIRSDLEPDLTIQTNPDLLALILNNLLSNLIEYAPNESAASIQLSSNLRTFTLSFSNAAPHLDAKDVKEIFQRFWRKDKSRTSSEHSGLGLSIAYSAAKALNLKLSADLSADQTIVFQISGPKA